MTTIEKPSGEKNTLAAPSGGAETQVVIHEAPVQPDQEWANALTHGIGALGSVVLGVYLVMAALPKEPGLATACVAYSASVFGTFFFSTMSHVVRRQPLLNTMRSYDQAMIYMMISGTYTPIIFQVCERITSKSLVVGDLDCCLDGLPEEGCFSLSNQLDWHVHLSLAGVVTRDSTGFAGSC